MKKKITITVSQEIIDFIDGEIKKMIYRNRSHGFESSVFEVIKRREEENE